MFPAELRIFSHLIVFDFESLTVPDMTLNNTELTSWIGKLVPISVSISSNQLEEIIFLCNSDPNQLIRNCVSNLELISQKSAILIKEKLQHFISRLEEKYRLPRDKVPMRENEGLVDDEAETGVEDEEDSSSTKDRRDLKILSSLRQDLKNYYSTIPVFGFNISRYNLKLIKEYLLLHLLTERNVVPKVIRTGNKYIGMKFLGLPFLDILNFLRGATTLINFLKAYGASEEKGFLPYERFDSAEKLNETQLLPIESFWSKLKNHNVLSVDYDKFMDCKERELKKRNL